MSDVPVAKDETREGPIPTVWREPLKRIADALTAGSMPHGDDIRAMDPAAARTSFANMEDYPDRLGVLAESAWATSVYIWMRDYWDCLIDLSTIKGARSDLVLQVRVYELGGHIEFAPHLVYVP